MSTLKDRLKATIEELKEIKTHQLIITAQATKILEELKNIKCPKNLDDWTNSLSDLNDKHFSLSDYKKSKELLKEMDRLQELTDINENKIKVIKIQLLQLKIEEQLNS